MGAVQFFFEVRIKTHHEKQFRGPPPKSFPLADCFDAVIQLLSMLHPIYMANTKSQGNSANMVHVLLPLYKV